MQMKTFEAATMKDAIKAVKSEFGSNAVIIKTKEKREGNIPTYEVTAAVHDKPRNIGASSSDSSLSLGFAREQDDRLQSLEIKFNSLADQMVTKSQIGALESSIEEIKMMVAEALRTKEGSIVSNLNSLIADIYRQLSTMGVDEAHLAQLTKFLGELPESERGPSSASEYYKTNAIRWMLKRIPIANKWSPKKGSMLIEAFVGPSGSGKTSLIAKIASQYSRNEKSRVLIVSADNQKLGSTDQLRILSKLIGVDFAAIDSPSELETLLSKKRDCDLVLIDTPGTSPKNKEKIAEIKALGSLNIPLRFHLVLAATEKLSQLDRCVRNFSDLAIDSLCVSKLDETWSYGDIFNICSKWDIPLSFFTTGQKIPEDIERASRERVVERIFSL